VLSFELGRFGDLYGTPQDSVCIWESWHRSMLYSNFLFIIFYLFSEYETTSGKGNLPSEGDEDDDFSDGQRDQEGFGHNSNTAPSSMSSNVSGSSTNVSSSDFNTFNTEQTTSVTSECSTTSKLPHSSQYVAAVDSKALDNGIDKYLETGSADYKELQGKCFSSGNLNDGGDSAVKRPDLFRFKSWSPNYSEGETGGKLDSGRDGRSLINRSVSHEPNCKKSKEGKSLRKKFISLISKRKRQKKSSEQSSKEEKSGTVETSMNTSGTAMSSYSEAAPKPCENLSPLNVTEARKLSLTDSLSSAESIASPISPGYESGYMSSEGNAQCTCMITKLLLNLF